IIPFCKLIVDAKYKLNFLNKDDKSLRTDIREVVGYSRSEKIRKIMDVSENEVVHCLIIYPTSPCEKAKEPEDEDILNSAEPMKGVNNFFTLKIPIPEIQT
ncbi:MAG: hypothetical protein IKX94_03420, partial [Muribaculaceae bacterium]|nr:hypothetical protein [Muribaculaceae bacterium]